MRRPPGTIHIYAVYELFGIPRAHWLDCIVLQTTANFEERAQINRYLLGRRRQG